MEQSMVQVPANSYRVSYFGLLPKRGLYASRRICSTAAISPPTSRSALVDAKKLCRVVDVWL